ncbi:MAG: hypothetical protein JJ966_10105 [Balneolaceae bacterium]|nr:hypothetical protein [Balneolaceae bacterium]
MNFLFSYRSDSTSKRSKILPTFLWALIITVIFGVEISAQALQFRGYVKELGSLAFSNDLGTVNYDNIVHNRLETVWDANDNFELKLDLRNRLISGNSVSSTPLYADFLDDDPGFLDMSWILLESDAHVLHSTIDRAQLTYFNGPFEATLGRQRINWGQTFVWSPNDLFNAYAYLDFDYEERPGTDAFSAEYAWGFASSVNLGYRFGDSLNESVIAVMYRDNFAEYDIQLLAGSHFDEWMVGAGWSGYFRDAGFKGEISYFQPKSSSSTEKNIVTASMGFDYMLPNAVYISGEFLYNGGFESAGNTLAQISQPPSADNLFIAKTGFYLNGSFSASPLTTISLSTLGSFDESVFILIPQVSYSISENTDLLFLSQLLRGDGLTAFTNTPNLLFFRVKWSF